MGFDFRALPTARTANLLQEPNDVPLFTPSSCGATLVVLQQTAETFVANDFVRLERFPKGCVFAIDKAKELTEFVQTLLQGVENVINRDAHGLTAIVVTGLKKLVGLV